MFRLQRVSATVLAVLSGAAAAQSSVTIYGRMDMGLVAGSFDGTSGRTLVSSGAYTASRLGFRGTEDLGGGMQASFGLEAGLNLDLGTGGTPNFFSRGSQVALSSAGWGEIALGRMYMPTFWVYLASDPGIGGLGLGSMGAAITQQHTALTGNTGWGGFYSNAVRYRTPTLSGVKAELAYSMGAENASDAVNKNDGKTWGFNVQYEDGPLYLGGAYLKNTTSLAAAAASGTTSARLAQDADQTSWMLAGRYKIAPATIGVNYGEVKNNVAGACLKVSASGAAEGCDMKTFLVSTRFDIGGQSAVDLSYAQLRAGSGLLAGAKANTFAVGYTYYLSKRTWLYTQAVKMNNNSQSAWGLNAGLGAPAVNGTKGFSPHAFSVGMLHMF